MSDSYKYLLNSATEGRQSKRGSMGTVVEGFDRVGISGDIESMLKDKLSETNPRLTSKQRVENKYNKKNKFLGRTGYNRNTYGFINGKFIFLSADPKPFFNEIPDYKITWHQSQWKNQKEVVETFIDLFGPHNAYHIFFNGRTHRIDAFVDIEFDYDTAKKAIYRSGVSVVENHKSDLKTCYLGAKGPKQAVFYEKEIKRKNLDLKFKKSKEYSHNVRVESRFFNSGVPIKNYSEYSKLSEVNMFDHIKTHYFKPDKLKSASSSRKIDKVREFCDLVEKEGIHHARRKLNKNRNFYRTIEPLLKEVGIDLNLSKKWKKKVRDRIVGEFCIKDYFRKEYGL